MHKKLPKIFSFPSGHTASSFAVPGIKMYDKVESEISEKIGTLKLNFNTENN